MCKGTFFNSIWSFNFSKGFRLKFPETTYIIHLTTGLLGTYYMAGVVMVVIKWKDNVLAYKGAHCQSNTIPQEYNVSPMGHLGASVG